MSLCPRHPCLRVPRILSFSVGDPHHFQPAWPHIVELKCPLIRRPQCPAEDWCGLRLYVETPIEHSSRPRDGVFAALMKKIYLGAELLSSLSPFLQSPDKGFGFIFNTVPLTGHSVGWGGGVYGTETAKNLQTNMTMNNDLFPLQTKYVAQRDFMTQLSSVIN